MLTQSQKLAVFFSIALYIAAFLLKKIYSNKLDLFNWAFFPRVMGFVLLMIPLLSVSFMSRDENYNLGMEEMLSTLLQLFKGYSLGQIYAFSDFFSFYLGANYELTYINDLNSYGYYTFMGIFQMFGVQKDLPPSIFQDYYYYKDLSTNIYTIYRSLINDFGGVGAIFFMFTSGLVAHAIFYRLLTHRRDWLACSAFMVTVVFIIGTYLHSIFSARWSILLLVAFTFILWVNNIYWRNQNVRMHRK